MLPTKKSAEPSPCVVNSLLWAMGVFPSEKKPRPKQTKKEKEMDVVRKWRREENMDHCWECWAFEYLVRRNCFWCYKKYHDAK